jgi:hypothetical protein
MGRVFISYARQDLARARSLADALQSLGIRLWWDEKIHVGQVFTDAIANAIAQASAVVVLWSRASVRSDWVQREAAEARRLGRLLPVLLDPVALPAAFADLDCAVLTGWRPGVPNREFDDLLRALMEISGAHPKSRGNWTVTRLDPTTLLVSLDRERHTVRYAGAGVYVDGRKMPAQGNPLDWERIYHFSLNDGDRQYPAQLSITITMFQGRVKRMKLSVGGRPLYDG